MRPHGSATYGRKEIIFFLFRQTINSKHYSKNWKYICRLDKHTADAWIIRSACM